MAEAMLKRKPCAAPIGQNGQTRPPPGPRLGVRFYCTGLRLGVTFCRTGPSGNECFAAQYISAV